MNSLTRDVTWYFGCLFASLVQVYVPTRILTSISATPVIAILLLMVLSFLLSLCSEADAFVGSSLLTSFGVAPVLAFLVIGPMLDVKKSPHDETLSQSTLHLAIHGHRDSSCLALFLYDRSDAMIRFIILLGYFVLTLYLQLSGKLSHYINLHYSYLVYISMILSLLLALVQFYIWIKKINSHSHMESRRARQISLLLLSLPLLIGVAFPTVSLDSRTVSAKGYHFPLAEGIDIAIQASEGTSSQYLKPDTSNLFFQVCL